MSQTPNAPPPVAGMLTATSPSFNFLRQCFTCERALRDKKDVYIYMGEYSFCSQECRTFFALRLKGEYIPIEPRQDRSLSRPETPKRDEKARQVEGVAMDADNKSN